jgi:hypothetical protein
VGAKARGVKTVRVRVQRPTSGWVAAACYLAPCVQEVTENIPLYVVLRQVQMKMAGADSGDLITQVLPFEFSVESGRMLKSYLQESALDSLDPFLDLHDRLHDALDDHEEAELDREWFARLRERAIPPAETVRECWDVEGGVQGTEEDA